LPIFLAHAQHRSLVHHSGGLTGGGQGDGILPTRPASQAHLETLTMAEQPGLCDRRQVLAIQKHPSLKNL